MLIIFIGPPGSGKGTQASLLCEHLSITHLSTGDMFRTAIQQETELGRHAQDFMNQGELVPDQLVVDMVAEAISRPPQADGCLLDGFPRSLPQAEALDEILSADGNGIDAVLELDVDEDTLVARLLDRQRPDDTLETIQNRLEVYSQQTSPLLDYYRQRGQLTSIDGKGTVQDVHERILADLPSGKI